MPKLKLAFYQLDKLLEIHAPEISKIFKSKEISSDLYSTQWFITLFSYDIDYIELSRVWDLFILKGWKIIFKIAISLLKSLQPPALNSESDTIIESIKLTCQIKPLTKIIKQAISLKITNKDLKMLEQEYKQFSEKSQASTGEIQEDFIKNDFIDSPPPEDVSPFGFSTDFGEANAGRVYEFPVKTEIAEKYNNSIARIPRQSFAMGSRKIFNEIAKRIIPRKTIHLNIDKTDTGKFNFRIKKPEGDDGILTDKQKNTNKSAIMNEKNKNSKPKTINSVKRSGQLSALELRDELKHLFVPEERSSRNTNPPSLTVKLGHLPVISQ